MSQTRKPAAPSAGSQQQGQQPSLQDGSR